MFQSEYIFSLPKGYVDSEGNLHREGTMRLATAADEILPLKDGRVSRNPAYLVVILLSRVVTKLGSLDSIHPAIIEGLFAEDLHFLQNYYNEINGQNQTSYITCPGCEKTIEVKQEGLGELEATPSTNSTRR